MSVAPDKLQKTTTRKTLSIYTEKINQWMKMEKTQGSLHTHPRTRTLVCLLLVVLCPFRVVIHLSVCFASLCGHFVSLWDCFAFLLWYFDWVLWLTRHTNIPLTHRPHMSYWPPWPLGPQGLVINLCLFCNYAQIIYSCSDSKDKTILWGCLLLLVGILP